MTKTYVSKRFRCFRKSITRKYARGGYIPNPGVYVVGDYVPEYIIEPNVTTWTLPNKLWAITKTSTTS